MDINKIQKNYRGDLKTIQISIRTTREISDWMKANQISPTKLFNEAVREVQKDETETQETA